MTNTARIPISVDDCICNLDGSQDTNTYDGSFVPRADCPVHGREQDLYYIVEDTGQAA